MDEWGNDENNGNVLEWFISNFLIPGYPGKVKTLDDVETVLLGLYDEYGNGKPLST